VETISIIKPTKVSQTE